MKDIAAIFGLIVAILVVDLGVVLFLAFINDDVDMWSLIGFIVNALGFALLAARADRDKEE